jgi:hypothetical protein
MNRLDQIRYKLDALTNIARCRIHAVGDHMTFHELSHHVSLEFEIQALERRVPVTNQLKEHMW